MLRLRNDLKFERQNDHKLLVYDPISSSVFEFGEQEAFLIYGIRAANFNPSDLMLEFNAKFAAHDGIQELEEFLAILDSWGLLVEDNSSKQPSYEMGKLSDAQPHDTDKVAIDDHNSSQRFNNEINRGKRWHLFCPKRLFDTLNFLFSPLQRLVWLIPVLLVYSSIAVWFNRHLLLASLAITKLHFGVLSRLIFAGLTVNLAVHIWRGIVARHYKLSVPSFGIVLAFGVIPRFNTQVIYQQHLAKNQKIWLAGTSLLVQLALFSIGVILWLLMRASGSLLSSIGAELSLIAAISFLLMASPLWGSDGYRLLAIIMDAPNLRQQAKHALTFTFFNKRPKVLAKYAKNQLGLAVFGIASILFPLALFAFIATGAAQYLKSNYQGAGLALFAVVSIYVLRNILLNHVLEPKTYQQPSTAQAIIPFSKAESTPITTTQHPIPVLAHKTTQEKASKNVKLRWRYAVALLFILVLFLPYSYETGGSAHIFPTMQQQIYAETDGVIERVHYQGGEWLLAGTVIAEMAHHRQQKDVSVTKAALAVKMRDLDWLRTTPSTETLHLAEKQLATARLQLRYSSEEAERFDKLFNKGVVTAQAFDDSRKKRDLDRQSVAEKQASLEALKAQINPNQIAAAEAELQKLREDLVFFEEQLRRTQLRMPFTGRIATMKLQNLRGKYLEEGHLCCEVEDIREARLEIAIPEADIQQVQLGNRVRFKTWAQPAHIFKGVVAEIAPQATTEIYGNTVTVIAILPNSDLTLKTGMSGYAKIQGEDTLVVIAFTRAIIRFFLVEMWSWLP